MTGWMHSANSLKALRIRILHRKQSNGDRRRPDSGAGDMNRICGANKSLPVTVPVSRLARRSTKETIRNSLDEPSSSTSQFPDR